ncbi:unnamed protein product, partial [Mesorhabditis belari]|uniref:Uncharacterized protein n=1 Tax=Mesorhabditis belari TaxID=2138241 RepID=A0AAF3J2G1_9BILA
MQILPDQADASIKKLATRAKWGVQMTGILNDFQLDHFINFTVKWKKSYHSEEEVQKRAKIWKENKKEIDEENKKARGYKLGENLFTDMDDDEKAKYVMDINTANAGDEAIKKIAKRGKRAAITYVGELKDWRRPAWMPAIRDQGSCGSCYAFAAINAIEVQWNSLGHTAQFSEQQIVDCTGDNYGCGGGWPERVFNYSYYYGNAGRGVYPYTGKKGVCRGTARSYIVSNWYHLTTLAQMVSYNYWYGPIAFSINVPSSLYSYVGGIFYPPQSTCTSIVNRGAHAMSIVGYGAQNGVPYWIVRNSWGASWGEGGYFRMRKGVNNCGMEKRGVYIPFVYGQS